MKTVHENIILKSHVILSKSTDKSIFEIGEELIELGADNMVDGGFWILDIENNVEFYSPNFRNVLGFEEEEDFPSVPESWQKHIDKKDLEISFDNYSEHIKTDGKTPYHQIVTYTTKEGNTVKLVCSGNLVKSENGNPKMLIGTHKLL